MEGRHRILLLIPALRVLAFCAAFALAGVPAHAAEGDEESPQADQEQAAEQIIQPELDRREIEEANIDTEDYEIGAFVGLMSIEDFSTEVVVGIRLAYHISESFFVEAAYGQTSVGETSFERLTGIPLATDEERDLKYYNLSLGYNLLPGESFVGSGWAFNNAIYLIGGIGSTTFFDDQRFTINAGVGYRLLLTDWLAAHIDMRDHIFNMDALGEDKSTHNLELHGGVTVFF